MSDYYLILTSSAVHLVDAHTEKRMCNRKWRVGQTMGIVGAMTNSPIACSECKDNAEKRG